MNELQAFAFLLAKLKGTPPTWGSITGNIADQTDLNNTINGINNQIDNLKNIGKFLALWDAETGLPTTQPPRGVPFNYSVGDYYRVTNVAAEGGINYKPNGSQYTGDASTTIETDDLEVGAIYFYDGTNWALQKAGAGGQVMDVQINGTTILVNGIANIPKASDNALGLVRTNASTYGIAINADGKLYIVAPTDADITSKSSATKPITCSKLDKAIEVGVKTAPEYQTFTCEMADGTTKTLKMYCEIA